MDIFLLITNGKQLIIICYIHVVRERILCKFLIGHFKDVGFIIRVINYKLLKVSWLLDGKSDFSIVKLNLNSGWKKKKDCEVILFQ